MTDQIRVLIVDDHAQVRRTLADLLSEYPDLQVVGFAVNAEEAFRRALQIQPDVILMDVMMPGERDGADMSEVLSRIAPYMGVIILTSGSIPQIRERLVDVPIGGYLQKGEVSTDKLVSTIRMVHEIFKVYIN